MKPALRMIAVERMQILVHSAAMLARTDPALSRRHAQMARRISTRHRVRMPYELRMAYCRKCKSFIAPGVHSRIRVGGPERSVRVRCGFCGHTNRKMLPRAGIPGREGSMVYKTSRDARSHGKSA
ncbi:RNase P subunit [Cenarchaeum symbiosum A]|uniref:Ribonuclease P protein component 4 n=1 Tax=Cenarchaeum symbiosum (strain A) TaxID=414004 RepID=A0RYG0_CENSY|nr:RNase P subunit [Cenarchaeum symbiosum A]